MGNNAQEKQDMLEYLGMTSVDQLMDETVPDNIRLSKKERFKYGRYELEGVDSGNIIGRHMLHLSSVNSKNKSYQGQGFYPTIVPAVIVRNLMENPKWYTPYTPYQAEISQGRLESLLNFQTMVKELTQMDVANASLLDEATACAEAVALANSYHKEKRTKFFVSDSIFPQNLDVMKTRSKALGIELVVGAVADFPWLEAEQFSGILV